MNGFRVSPITAPSFYFGGLTGLEAHVGEGVTGATGAAFTGPTGPQGATGVTGATGPSPPVTGPTGSIQYNNGHNTLGGVQQLYFDQIEQGVAIGYSSPQVTPTGGLIISGKVGINTASPATGSLLEVDCTTPSNGNGYGFYIAGTSLATTSNSVYGQYNVAKLGAATGATGTNAYWNYIYPDHSSNGGTVAAGYGLYIDAGAPGSTVTAGYSLWCNTPGFGTARKGLVINGSDTAGVTGGCEYGMHITGTTVGDDSSNSISLVISTVQQPTLSGRGVIGLFCQPSAVVNGTNTIPQVIGGQFDPVGHAGAGVVLASYGVVVQNDCFASTAYGLYVTQPSTGTNKYCGYFGGPVGVNTTSTTATLAVQPYSSYPYGILNNGTLTGNDGSASIGIYNAPVHLSSVSLSNYQALRQAPIFGISAAGQTITTCYNIYAVNSISSQHAGTITNTYGAFIDAGVAGGTGTVTNAYGLKVVAPVIGTNKYTAYFDAGVGIGATNATNGNGLIFGINANTSSNYSVDWRGSNTNTAGSYSIGFNLGFVAAPTSSIGNFSQMEIYPQVNCSGQTITTNIGLRIDNGSLTAGTVTNAYSLYVDPPAFGNAKYCAYFGGIIGVGNVTPGTDLYLALNRTGTSGQLYGLQIGGSFDATSGTVTNADGVYVYMNLNGNASTISNAAGVEVNGASSPGGTVTTAYGVLIDAVGWGTSTAYGLYVNTPVTATNKYTSYLAGVNLIGGSATAVNANFVNDPLQIYTGNVNQGLVVQGTQTASTTCNVGIFMNNSVGAYNSVVSTGDAILMYCGTNSSNRGGFCIAPWQTATTGMRFDSGGLISNMYFTTSGGTPDNLNYYETYTVTGANCVLSGGGTNTIQTILRFVKIGKVVNLEMYSSQIVNNSVGSSNINISGYVPARMQPDYLAFTALVIPGYDNGAISGWAELLNANIVIYNTNRTSFATGHTCGWSSFTWTWVTPA